MCGIVGIATGADRTVDREVLEKMTASLRHRGPDASGIEIPVPWVGLGHRRLSIIDLAGGAQPMSIAGDRIWITFNGEIFNYRELREELCARHEFRTESDTEVLLALYEQEGESGFYKLLGQYAFAIWDGRDGHNRIVAGRDPMGIKPFYYSFDGDRLLFASEPRALLLHPDTDRSIDPYGLHLFLRYRFIPAPRTAWRSIRKLRPGELLTLEGGRLERGRIWDLSAEGVETMDDPRAAHVELESLLDQAVDRQKIADVPVGAFLSGGLDSSTMAALLMRHSQRPITTFTIGFASADHDESPYAAEVARHIGSNHVAETMGLDEAENVIAEILDHLDEPFGDPSLVPTWLLCRLASKHHKVVLSGDGGDELFGGYSRIYRALGILAWPAPMRPLHRILRRMRRPGQEPHRWQGDDQRVDREYRRSLEDIHDRGAQALYGTTLKPALDADPDQDPIRAVLSRSAHLPPFSRILFADMEAHLADYHLVKVDRASMAHGLEVRVPFLDLTLVERAFRFSADVRLSGGRTKGLLRDVMAPLLPSVAITRDKRGFGPPITSWIKEGLGDAARARLLDGAAVQQGFLNRDAVAALLEPGRRSLKGSRIWRLLVLENWLRRR